MTLVTNKTDTFEAYIRANVPLLKASFNNHSIDLGTAFLFTRALCALVFSIYSLKQILDTAKVSPEVVSSGNNELYLHSQNKKFIRRR